MVVRIKGNNDIYNTQDLWSGHMHPNLESLISHTNRGKDAEMTELPLWAKHITYFTYYRLYILFYFHNPLSWL